MEISSGKKIDMTDLLKKETKLLRSIEKLKRLSEKKNEMIFQLKEMSLNGGRPKKKRKLLFIHKPNGLIETQQNNPLLNKYYLNTDPKLDNPMTDKILNLLGQSTFYHHSSSYAYLEDAILLLAHAQEPITVDSGYYVYECPFNAFIEFSGATEKDKSKFKKFLQETFEGDKSFDAAMVFRSEDRRRFDITEQTILKIDFEGLREETDLVTIYLSQGIFKTIIGTKKRNYISYPAQLNRQLQKATKENTT